MIFYPFHLGDYAAHTAHLDLLEDLAYRRLLDLYYLREAPIPADVQEAARLIRMKAHVDCVESVLKEFFELSDDGWRHGRCDEEIAHMKDRQAKARASAEASVKARQAKSMSQNDRSTDAQRTLNDRSTDAQRTLNDRSTDAQRTLNDRSTDAELPIPIPIPIPSTTTTTSLRSVVVQRPSEIPEDIWKEFLAIRKARRAPLTKRALDGIQREARKAGISIADAMTICIERGWQSFQASWDWRGTARHVPTPENFAAKDYGNGGDI